MSATSICVDLSQQKTHLVLFSHKWSEKSSNSEIPIFYKFPEFKTCLVYFNFGKQPFFSTSQLYKISKILIEKMLYTHSFVYTIFKLHNYADHYSDVTGLDEKCHQFLVKI